jgi:RNA-directed DNA polymerase
MKNFEKYKKIIAKQFRSARSIDDLISLLNEIQRWECLEMSWDYPIDSISRRALNYYLYKKKDKYIKFTIPKKSGGRRSISAPDRFLKKVQRLLNIGLTALYAPGPIVATGFIYKKSVVTNAKMHVGKKYVYNIDILDFFPSIPFKRIWAVLSRVSSFGLDNEVARIVANICTDNGSLPQGAPTSPIISNIICLKLDRKLRTLAKGINASYSRYADDITFSSNENIFTDSFKAEIINIIQEEGFAVNMAKERLQRYNIMEGDKIIRERQEVTGIIVNQKPNVSRQYLRTLRAILHNWSKYGYFEASQLFAKYHNREKGSLRNNGKLPPLENFVSGKLEYLGMVRGKEDPIYLSYKLQFDSLCIATNEDEKALEGIAHTLEIWKTKGIKKAADNFYNIKNVSSQKSTKKI